KLPSGAVQAPFLASGARRALDLSSLRRRPLPCPAGLGFGHLLILLEKLDRLPRHHRGDRMLIHELRMGVPPQQNTKVIKPSNDPLELNAIDEEYGYRGFVFPDVVQEHVLNIL